MNLPIDSKEFSNFIFQNNLFEKTLSLMNKFLENWFIEDKERFIEEFNGDFTYVINTYTFEHGGVSFTKNFESDDPPLDYISVWIGIVDQDGSYLCTYTAFYDYNLNCIDDKVGV